MNSLESTAHKLMHRWTLFIRVGLILAWMNFAVGVWGLAMHSILMGVVNFVLCLMLIHAREHAKVYRSRIQHFIEDIHNGK